MRRNGRRLIPSGCERKQAPPALAFESRVERFDDRPLPFCDFYERVRFFEPAAAIDLGKLRDPARFRRPRHFKRVAGQFRGIAISLKSPDMKTFAAGLSKYSQIIAMAFDVETRFLPELATRAGERIFSRSDKSLWDRPGSVVFRCPVGTTGMNEKDLQTGASAPIKQNACAQRGHQCVFRSRDIVVPPRKRLIIAFSTSA